MFYDTNRQDPVETTFAFICSSNNNIKRITGMVQALSRNFGSHIGTWRDTDFYSFPSVQALSGDGIEAQLRELGFGYRAKYISQSAQFLCSERPDNPDAWLTDLRGQSYPLVKESLLKLMGVGPKVADCIALMAMDVTECVPVDTHVWQIALRDYSFPGMNGRHKSLTEKTYTAIGDGFRNVFGAYAGWAHSVLFAADLRHLQLLVQEEDALQSKTEEKLEIPIKEEAHISIKKEESTTLEEDSFVCDEDTLVEADIKPDLKRLKAE